MNLVVATFYKFVPLLDVEEIQGVLRTHCQQQEIQGTILLASEGINGTIAGSREGIDIVLNWLRSHPFFADLEAKESFAESQPFKRLRVRCKQEIVTLGKPEVNPMEQVGTYVEPQDWNEIICDPEVMVVDTRNDYEVKIGTFEGANNPQTDTFRQFPDYVNHHLDPSKHKKVALFCTGGIRCEKATSFMLSQGFEEVYHLKGGILKYLEEVPVQESLWQGECFVFDERVALKHGLESGSYDLCRACGYPVSLEDKLSPKYEPRVSCPYCAEENSSELTEDNL